MVSISGCLCMPRNNKLSTVNATIDVTVDAEQWETEDIRSFKASGQAFWHSTMHGRKSHTQLRAMIDRLPFSGANYVSTTRTEGHPAVKLKRLPRGNRGLLDWLYEKTTLISVDTPLLDSRCLLWVREGGDVPLPFADPLPAKASPGSFGLCVLSQV